MENFIYKMLSHLEELVEFPGGHGDEFRQLDVQGLQVDDVSLHVRVLQPHRVKLAPW